MDKEAVARVHRQMARKGGVARARAVSSEDRIRIARMGGLAGGRGRKKKDRISAELANRIRELVRRTGVSAMWYMSDAMKNPQFRPQAREVLRAIARHGSLDAYKAAHELIKCL